MLADPTPHGGANRVVVSFGLGIFRLGLLSGADEDLFGLVGLLHDGRHGMPLFEVAGTGTELGPPFGCLQHGFRQVLNARLLPRASSAAFEDEHAGEEAIGEHPLRECLVVVVGDRRAEDRHARLIDHPRQLLARLAPHGKHAVGARVER